MDLNYEFSDPENLYTELYFTTTYFIVLSTPSSHPYI